MSAVKMVIKQPQTQRYWTRDGTWTLAEQQALTFESARAGVEFMQARFGSNAVTSVQLVWKGERPENDVVLWPRKG